MSSSKKTVIIVLISVMVLVISYFAYVFYKQMKEPVSPAINAIPPDVSVILETKDITNIWNNIKDDNAIWNEIMKIDQLSSLDKMLSVIGSRISEDKRVEDIIRNRNFYISIHTSFQQKSNSLLLFGMNNARESSIIEKFIEKSLAEEYSITSYKYQDLEINNIQSNDNKISFYFSISRGVAIGSANEELIKSAIDQLSGGVSVTTDKSFQKVRITSGKKVDANVYINYNNFNKTLRSLVNHNSKELVQSLQNLAEWTELDLTIKNDELLLNGFTSVNVTGFADYLRIFEDQEPQSINITDVMPFNTIYFLTYSFNNIETLYNSYKSYLEFHDSLNSYNEIISGINNELDINIEQSLIPWIKNHMAIAITDHNTSSSFSNTFLIIQSTDIETAENELLKLAGSINIKTKSSNFEYKYNNHIIRQIDIPNLFPLVFGKQFAGLTSNFYTSYNDYMIFANDANSLIRFINTVSMDKTLANNDNYVEFSDNITEKSNIFLYCNLRKSINMISSGTDEVFSKFINDNSEVLKNFEAFSVQFSSNSDLYYSNTYFKYNASYKEDQPSVWAVDLDSEISGKPYIIKDHTDNSGKIIVFDKNNNMYLIDLQGNIIWRKQLEESIISKVQQVDYYKNGKIQYLFNTKNHIHIIDLKGNNVADYPIKLPAEATNGLALFDYSNKKDYRILIACNDNKVYNFNIKGQKVKGWKMKKTASQVSTPLKHLVSSKKDYIITTENNGRFYISDRKGYKRMQTPRNTNNSLNSDIYLNKTNSRGLLLTTDTNGDLIYITKRSGIKKTSFGDFSKDHYFLYEDFNNDDSNDFIFLDKNKLVVYDRFKKVILSHNFNSDINNKPQFVKPGKNQSLLGIINPATNIITLFNKDGILETGFDITGSTPFAIGKSKSWFLITASGKTIFRYDLPEY